MVENRLRPFSSTLRVVSCGEDATSLTFGYIRGCIAVTCSLTSG